MLGNSGYPRKDLDAYWTRPWCTEWLVKHQFGDECPPEFKKSVVWEPAAGLGGISRVLLRRGFDVLSTDIHNHGWAGLDGVQDFLQVPYVDPAIQIIWSNPPYDLAATDDTPEVNAEAFVRHAIRLMEPVGGRVYMFLRHEFECAQGRRDLFQRRPYAAKFSLTHRPEWTDPTMPKKAKKVGPRFNYAWFMWDWQHQGPPSAYLLPSRKEDWQ